MTSFPKLGVLLLLAMTAAGQDSDQRLGSYRALNAFELGYRAVTVDGSHEMYRASINYKNGFRLLDGILRIHSGDGHGKYVDEITLTTFGQGGDPYQASSLRLEKNRFYRYELGFRIVNYNNQLLSLSGGEHRQNTERIFQSHDLTLFPQRRFQLLLGFDRVNQNGPALTSENIAVTREEAFPRDRFFVFADRVRRVNNTWRAGIDGAVGALKISFLRGWDFYKEDTSHSPPDVETNGLVPRSFRRDDPVHGSTPFTRLNLYTDANRLLAVNGRFVYAGGDRNFVLDENISSLNPVSNVVVTRQAFVLGLARRTQGTGDVTVTFQPGERWTFSNATSLNHSRIVGDSAFVELRAPASPADPDRDSYFFSLLGIRLITNSTDLNFRPVKTVGLYAGYHYSRRRIQSREILEDISGRPTDVELFSFENTNHSGLAGVRLRPLPALTLLLDGEYGRADRPFTPVSERRFHAETARVQWKNKAWLAGATFRTYYNRNAIPPVIAALEGAASGHRYRSRQYSANFGWTPRTRYALDLSYAKLHLDTASAILNFPVPTQVRPADRRSLYRSNLHHGHITARVDLHTKLALSVGYSIVKDTAEPPRVLFAVIGPTPQPPPPPFVAGYPNFAFDGTDLINAYPLTYHSPQARLTWRLHPKVSWNVGWQYYAYRERFSRALNYHANVSYTSFRWAF